MMTLFLTTLLASQAQACYGQNPALLVERPNVLLVLLDDADVRAAGFAPAFAGTSTIAPSAVFASAYASTSVCTASRASILTGRYAHNHGQLRVSQGLGGFERYRSQCGETDTIATRLQRAGYRTAFLGKYINGYPGSTPTYVPPGWTYWFGHRGDAYYGWTVVENGVPYTYGTTAPNYETDVVAAKAVAQIEEGQSSGPWLIVVSPLSPHEPVTPAQRHRFASIAPYPRGPAFDEVDRSDKPAAIRNLPPLSDAQIATIEQLWAQRARAMLGVEDLMRSLYSALDRTSQRDSTIVLATSDNGFHLGEHSIWKGKETPYQESIRIPFAASGPGIVPRTVDALVGHVDVYPTILELAGLEVPERDGRSLVPLLRGEDPPDWRSDLLISHWQSSVEARRDYGLITADRRKLISRWLTSTTRELEYYDLTTDPYELESRPSSAAPSLLSRAQALTTCVGRSCW